MVKEKHGNHAKESDFAMYIHGRLDAVRTFVVGHHLLGCHTCREHLSACIDLEHMPNPMGKTKLDQATRRFELCFTVGGPMEYQELSPFSTNRQKVSILDISVTGVGILAENPVLPGTILQIRGVKTIELGQVRHCSKVGDTGYRIGLRLHDGL